MARELTTQQQAFVERYFETGDARQAALDVGYSAPEKGNILLYNDRIVEMIARHAMRKFVRGAPEMMSIVESLARNVELSPRVRLEAAKTWLDRAGLIAPKAAAAKSTDAPLHEMTTDDLRELAARLEAEIGNRARPVAAYSDCDTAELPCSRQPTTSQVSAPIAPSDDSDLTDIRG